MRFYAPWWMAILASPFLFLWYVLCLVGVIVFLLVKAAIWAVRSLIRLARRPRTVSDLGK